MKISILSTKGLKRFCGKVWICHIISKVRAKTINEIKLFLPYAMTLLVLGCTDNSLPSQDHGQEVMALPLESSHPEIQLKALDKLASLAENNNPIAQYRYANILLSKKKEKDAIEWLQWSVALNDAHSAELLGFIYLNNDEVSDNLQGFELLTKSAESGLASAQLYLGTCLGDESCNLPISNELSFFWIDKAYDNGSSGAALFIDEAKSRISDVSLIEENYRMHVEELICTLDASHC
ncbi:hypothetical protein [Vibrio sp. SCSIO 43136]|uniref:tetratricopeptide repeat protein n=1 Tax=Vibrio sp. SCSIO 43136 TaxID=2819101 RepID=UPI002075071D|nr:hypothetical protein [Vibrio sp. SCSIO 43136]USD64596.1 sel1 repeat family protein [Vibrio sp. SCSIO 43136]